MPSRPSIRLALAAALLALAPSFAADTPPPRPIPLRVELGDHDADLQLLERLDLDIDAVTWSWARVYVNREQRDTLVALGFSVTELPDEGAIGLARLAEEGLARGATRGTVPAQYHDYTTLSDELAQIAADHPDLVRLSSLGTSVQGRNLWMVRISDNPDLEEDEPELVYISSMHGDEVVGKEMCVNLIHWLLDNYGSDPRATTLIDDAVLWIMPSMNPDGTELGQRYNAHGTDLNRDFPDQFIDPVDSTVGREPETAAVMDWMVGRSATIAANMHGGALVANYPFDSNPAGSDTFSPTPLPDHPTFVSIARTYADNNPPMSANNADPAFDNGITNGADWYSIHGGMQDYDYVWHGGFQLTLELSNVKWPPASQLPGFWDDNRESMLAYLERGLEGLRGVITAADTGLPVAAEVRVDSSPFSTHTDPRVGDYHRVILPGTYTVTVSSPSYVTQVLPGVQVAGGPATRLDLQLEPQPPDLEPASSRIEEGPGGDGAIDPGESLDLAVTLENLGRGATTVQGRLVPTGWFADVTREMADYPDLPMGASAESLAPYYGLTVDPATPPGHKLGFAVAWASAEASGLSDPFFLDVGQPTCVSANATDLPQTVSYVITAHSSVNLSLSRVSTVRVTVNVQHPYIGELHVTLTSPAGTAVILHNGTGGSADNIVGTYPDTLTPAQSLAAFEGESGTGTWRLDVGDSVLVNNGTLQAFGLELCGLPVETETPELRFRELSRIAGGARLVWWEYPGLTSYRVYRSTDPSSAAAFVEVTGADPDPADTGFDDVSADPLVFYLVRGVGPQGTGPLGHFGQ